MRISLYTIICLVFLCCNSKHVKKEAKSFNFDNLLKPSQQQELAWADSLWKDLSPHEIQNVQANGLRFNYLDWGGTGPYLVFLHGMGHTAHQFDEIAPSLVDEFHVIGITLRGHGKSAQPAVQYNVDSLGKDVASVLNELKIKQAILAGHSLGGNVSNRVARNYPEKVKGVVYLDATKDTTFLNRARAAAPYTRPDPSTYNWKGLGNSRKSYRALYFRFWSDAQEADFRDQRTSSQVLNMDDLFKPMIYSDITVPQLSLCALDRDDLHFPWISDVERTKNLQKIKDYHNNLYVPWEQTGCDRFSREANNGKIIIVRNSHHYIHLVNKIEVVRILKDSF